MRASTARNVAMMPPQCPTTEAGPAPYYQKGFFHNGYIKSLKQLVHFYNTRDKYPYPVTSGHCPPGNTERVDCWPMTEVPNNIDMTVGKLGLTDTEENQIVDFLQTLDGRIHHTIPRPRYFYRRLHEGWYGRDPRQQVLIPTPHLPACASAICNVAPVPNPPIP